jgi:hypothetical protein
MEEKCVVRILGSHQKHNFDHETRMDTKTVAIVALGCTHPNAKVQSASIHFFIGQDGDDAPDESEDQHVRNLESISQFLWS